MGVVRTDPDGSTAPPESVSRRLQSLFELRPGTGSRRWQPKIDADCESGGHDVEHDEVHHTGRISSGRLRRVSRLSLLAMEYWARQPSGLEVQAENAGWKNRLFAVCSGWRAREPRMAPQRCGGARVLQLWIEPDTCSETRPGQQAGVASASVPASCSSPMSELTGP